MQTVAQILDNKGRAVHTIGPDDTIYEALERLAEHGIGALLVMEGDRLVGIISERDYARKVILLGRSSKKSPVRDVMTSEVLVVGPDTTVEECMAIMTEHRVRHLPVIVDGRVDGLISIGDVVRAVISHQRFVIDQLERYITS